MNPLTPYPITPIGSFLGVVLALLPLLSQIRKLSLAIWGYSLWIAVDNLQGFVNTIIWHDNVNIVAPVWCDIATHLQVGASIGTRACAFVVCVHLFKITRLRTSIETTKYQRHKVAIFELLLIIGLPFLVMALYIIIQPARFDLVEEVGCEFTIYSFVGYIIYYGPLVMTSLGCVVLAPLTLRTFWRYRKEMDEFLSSSQDITHNKYNRLMIIACLDTLLNVPVTIILLATDIRRGKLSSLNYPYISWKNVHNGEGGIVPGASLSSILQIPASEWDTDKWVFFTVRWDEWVYVLHAIIFFSAFGTTPEMRKYYRSAFWFIPERCGYKRRQITEVATMSDVAFNSNPGQQEGNRPTANRRRGSLSFLETTIDTSASHSTGMVVAGDLGEATSDHAAQTATVLSDAV